MDGEKSTHRGVSSPKFLAQQRVAYVVHARTAIHRIDWSRQEAELSHAPDQVQGKFAFLVGFARDGGDLLLGKYASLGLNALLSRSQIEVHWIPFTTR